MQIRFKFTVIRMMLFRYPPGNHSAQYQVGRQHISERKQIPTTLVQIQLRGDLLLCW